MQDTGAYEEAEQLLTELYELRKQNLGPEHLDTLKALHNLAWAKRHLGKFAESERLNLEVLETSQRTLGHDHPFIVLPMQFRAVWLRRHGKDQEAQELDQQIVDIQRRIYGPEHPGTLGAMLNGALNNTHDPVKQELREILGATRRVLGPDHPQTLMCVGNLAGSLWNNRKFAESEHLYRQVLESQRKSLATIIQRPLPPSTVWRGLSADRAALMRRQTCSSRPERRFTIGT